MVKDRSSSSRSSVSLSGSGGQGCGVDVRIADVLVDDAGADVGDLRSLGQVVDDECVQILVVGDGNVQQEVLVASDDEDAEGLGLTRRPVAERLE
jgi:hypothetical protein